MTNSIDFNINEMVRVKLTDHGRMMHKKFHDDLFMDFLLTQKYTPPEEDSEGWSRWQLWMLMEVFGSHFSHGCDLPFDMGIQIIQEK